MFRAAIATFVFCFVLPVCGAQSSDSIAKPQNQPEAASVTKPTELVAPAVDQLSKAVSQTHLERWNRSVRDDTDSNLRSIERDLQNTLPPLLQTADAAPSSIAASLPVLRNLNALVAVLVRVANIARGTAPANEAQSLNNSLDVLEGARRSLDDQLQQLATAQEKQIADLQSKVKNQEASLAAAQTATPAASTTPAKAKKSKKSTKAQ